MGATENVKEGNEDIREVTSLIYSAYAIHTLHYLFLWLMLINLISKTSLCLLLSQGNQKQRWLPGMDPVLFGHVLFLSPLSGLVRQLTHLASMDSIRQETVWLWHILVISYRHDEITETECTVYRAGPGVQSALREDSVFKWRWQFALP